MPSIQEISKNLEKINHLLIRLNNLYEYAFNRIQCSDYWDDFLGWYEEYFEFLVNQKEELPNILNNLNHEIYNVF